MKNLFFIPIAILVFSFFFSCSSTEQESNITDTPKAPEISTDADVKTANQDSNNPTTEAIYGIDISKYQGDIMNDITDKDDISFIICKASGGSTERDPNFKNNWKKVKSGGYVRGAYHFYYTSSSGEDNAKNFLNTVGQFEASDLPPIIDIEAGGNNTKADKTDMDKELKICLEYIEKQTNRVPIIYSSHNFAQENFNTEYFARYPLWIADYKKEKEPRIPDAWKEKGWVFWQKSGGDYKVENISTDFDVFNGDKKSLEDFIKKH